MTRRHLIVLPTAAAMAAGLIATANGDVSSSALSRKATVTASDQLKFKPAKVRVKRGKVTIVMRNPASNIVDHAVAIKRKGRDARGKTVAPGGTSRAKARLKRGKYTFYCPVPGHRAGGMKGRVTVK
jgi:uncharacterized cupredoxin-like copper-binding protein